MRTVLRTDTDDGREQPEGRSTMKKRPLLLAACMLFSWTAACADPLDSEVSAAPQQTLPSVESVPSKAASPRPASSAEATTRPYAPTRKAKIPFEITSDPVHLRVGETADVPVFIKAIRPATNVRIEFRGGPGVGLSGGAFADRYGDLAAGESVDAIVSVTANDAGLQYVYLDVTANYDGRQRAGAFAVAIRVAGDAASAQKSRPDIVVDDTGQVLRESETLTR
jgi:hypothetical protein